MEILSQGTGALYADPSADRAREFFASKPRGLIDKLTTVPEAVARFVQDGDYLAIGGFGAAQFFSHRAAKSTACPECSARARMATSAAGLPSRPPV